MRKGLKLGAVLLLGMALTACKDEKPTDQRSATGEVLAGSISDSMLPYDSTKSHAPRAPERVAAVAASGADSGEVGDGEAATDSASDAAH
jgi:hypothetical protein